MNTKILIIIIMCNIMIVMVIIMCRIKPIMVILAKIIWKMKMKVNNGNNENDMWNNSS